MLSSSLIKEITDLLAIMDEDESTFTLSDGREARCFRGDKAKSQAQAAYANLPVNTIAISGVEEIVSGVYCFVL